MADEVRLSRDAEDDLRSIASYTADRYGAEQELHYRDGLRRAIETLLVFPSMGSDQSHIATGLRRHVHASHAIFYSHQPYGLLVERVLGPGQDPVREFQT